METGMRAATSIGSRPVLEEEGMTAAAEQHTRFPMPRFRVRVRTH
jgi:hypothetical protein